MGEDKNRATQIVLALMLFVALLSGALAGFELMTHVISPPAQFTGICKAPAQLIKGGCFTANTYTDSSGKQQTNYTPSGYVCNTNETISQCEAKGS